MSALPPPPPTRPPPFGQPARARQHIRNAAGDAGGPPTQPSPAARPSQPPQQRVDEEEFPSQHLSAGDSAPPGDGPPPDEPEKESPGEPWWRRWIAPGVLALMALGGGVGALLLDEHPSADSQSAAAAAETPVFSARRTPELLIGPLAEQRLAVELDDWATALPSDSCLVVSEASSTLYERNPDLPLPGASTQKLITTSAALLAGSPDDRYETMASSTATVEGGVLAGDLFVVGGGDPLLTTEGFRNQVNHGAEHLQDVGALADAVAEAGVTHIQGSVIGDDSRYDSERFSSAWPDRFREQNQAGPISALNVNDGFGEFPPTYGGLTARVPAADPAANAATVITEALTARGITVDGTPQSGTAPEGVQPVASLESVPLQEITTETLMDSDNESAEMLFKELGLDLQGTGSWEAGRTATAEVLTEAGVSFDEGLEIVDGSGLSHQNRLSCSLLVDLLTHPETGPLVVDGLAVGGESGTLAGRWNGTDAEGRVMGKTGTLRNVSALAGQVLPVDGGTLTYAYVATVPEPAQLTLEQTELFEPLGEILVAHSAGVDVAELLPAGYPDEPPEPDEEPSDEE